jgi:pimeloyl-ACP methyl ester carboxylesterase
MTYATVNGLELYYEVHGSGRPLVLLHGGLHTIGLSFGTLLEPLAAGRQVIAVELQGHGHTADPGRPMTIDALAGDVVALLDQLGVVQADVFGFSLGGLVGYQLALSHPGRIGRLIAASADPHRPPGRESQPISEDRLPTQADFQAMRDANVAAAPDPSGFEKLTGRVPPMVHEMPAWTDDQVRSVRTPTLLIFGDRDFSPLPDVAELLDLLPDGQLAVLPGTLHTGVTQRADILVPLITSFLDAG